jgi:hypothetical protein
MEAWPQLSVVPAPEGLQTPSAGVEVEAPLCVVRRSANMNALEQRLRFALVAHVGGARRSVTCAQVVEALVAHEVPASMVSVHSFVPKDFLVVFAKMEQRNMVAGLPSVCHAGFSLFFKPFRCACARRCIWP